MKLQFHYGNVLENQVGIQGLAEKEIIKGASRLKKIQQSLQKQREEKAVGFWDLPYQESLIQRIKDTAIHVREKFEYLVVLGIGGSSLGPNSLHQALAGPYYNYLPLSQREGPSVFFIDNVDPLLISGLNDVIELEKTLFVVITKSGGTAETLAQYSIARGWVEKELGKEQVPDHFVGITDPEKGLLREIINRENWLSFEVPPHVGGRFSLFSPVGLFSAACAGIDIEELAQGGRDMDQESRRLDNIFDNIPYLNALIHYLLYQKGKDISVMMPYTNALYGVADWYRQLWAESLGKKLNLQGEAVYTGQTPVKALGATDQHSQLQLYIEGPADKVITFIRVNNFSKDEKMPPLEPENSETDYLSNAHISELLHAECQATQTALTRNQRPNCLFELKELNPYLLGQLYYALQVQTVVTGGLLGINPFDQPGVEEGKKATKRIMRHKKGK